MRKDLVVIDVGILLFCLLSSFFYVFSYVAMPWIIFTLSFSVMFIMFSIACKFPVKENELSKRLQCVAEVIPPEKPVHTLSEFDPHNKLDGIKKVLEDIELVVSRRKQMENLIR